MDIPENECICLVKIDSEYYAARFIPESDYGEPACFSVHILDDEDRLFIKQDHSDFFLDSCCDSYYNDESIISEWVEIDCL